MTLKGFEILSHILISYQPSKSEDNKYENLETVCLHLIAFITYISLTSHKHVSQENNFKNELEKKDWKKFTYDESSEVLRLGKEEGIHLCVKAKPGNAQCCYAICQECYEKASGSKSGRVKRCKGSTQSNTKKHIDCHHGLSDLTTEMEPFWCDPQRKNDGLFTFNWMNRAKGCIGCNKMFVYAPSKDWNKKMIGKLDEEVRKVYSDLNSGALEQK